MEFLWNTAAFILTLGILVTIHEYGHFWVAHKLGIKVLTFSIGFGKALYQRRGKDGVVYIIGSIPLGGYVKMLDERESKNPIADEDQGSAFNQKSVWVRMAVVIAGPVANFFISHCTLLVDVYDRNYRCVARARLYS
ncbi:MAG: site-2 protease family protein [Enterobacterales bacterium]|nr:site-2 protease family protein [Enterobacterales bacterium]